MTIGLLLLSVVIGGADVQAAEPDKAHIQVADNLELPAIDDAALGDISAVSKPAFLIVMARNLSPENLKAYNRTVPMVYEKYGGKYLAVQSDIAVAEGAFGFETIALTRWPSLDAIRTYWASSDYQQIKSLRAGFGEFQIIAVEGLTPEPDLPMSAKQPSE